MNDACDLGYAIHYWRTTTGLEVDFVAYGERGIRAFEVKRTGKVRDEDLRGLKAFLKDYREGVLRLRRRPEDARGRHRDHPDRAVSEGDGDDAEVTTR